jgi:hypothetical protein
MTRTIRKKVFDDDLMLSDDFDEAILDKIDRQFAEPGTPGETGAKRPIPSLDDGRSGSEPSFSLDDFETTSNDDRDRPKRTERAEKPLVRPEHPTASAAEPPEKTTQRRIATPKLIIMGAACILFLLAAGFIATRLFQTPKPVHQITTVIKRSVPIPVRMEEHEFLILASSGQEKSLLTLALELKFHGLDGSGTSNQEDVALRDTIYQFLSDARPVKSSLKYWEKIVSNDLSQYLRTSFPARGLQTVRLTSLIRL